MLLSRSLVALSRSERVKQLATTMPVSSGIVSRFVAGEGADDAVRVSGQLAADGLLVSLDHLGEDTTDRRHADAVVAAYLDVLDRLTKAGLTRATEVSVKLSAVGQAISEDGNKIALDNARILCQARRRMGGDRACAGQA